VQLVWRAIRPLVKPDQRKRLRIVSVKEEPAVLRPFASVSAQSVYIAKGGFCDSSSIIDNLCMYSCVLLVGTVVRWMPLAIHPWNG
jgi:predicted nucleic acid-binding Zn finger protein